MKRRRLFVRPTLINVQKGFTLVELLIVMAVAGILMALVFGPMDAIWRSQTTEMATVVQQTDIKAALGRVSKDVVLAVSFLKIDTTDKVGPDPTNPGATLASPETKKWDTSPYTFLGNNMDKNILMYQKHATTVSDEGDNIDDPQRKVLWADSSCTSFMRNTFVYYVKDSVLWRRSIPYYDAARPNEKPKSLCAYVGASNLENGTKQTCPQGYNNTKICEGRDAKVLENVQGFKVSYYRENNAADGTPQEINSSDDISKAKYIRVQITVKKVKLEATDSVIVTRTNGES